MSDERPCAVLAQTTISLATSGRGRTREAVPGRGSAGAELDAALAAVAWATEDEG